MPQAIPAFAAVIIAAKGLTGFKAFALMMGSSLISHLFSQSTAKEVNTNQIINSSHLLTKRSTAETIPLIYGTCRMGTNQVYLSTSGSSNKYLHIIGVIGEGPVNGIAEIDGVDQIFLDDKLYTEYGDLVRYQFFYGTSTQEVCQGFDGVKLPNWNDPIRHTAYIYIRLEYNRDKFGVLPDITVVVEGLKVLDVTQEIPKTVFSNNPALCVYDFLTRPSTRGGMGIDRWHGPIPKKPRVDIRATREAANYCKQYNWTCDMPLTGNQAISDNLQLMLNNFRGGLVFSNNKFKLQAYKFDPPVMNFTENDIVSNGKFSTLEVTQPDIFERPNAVKATYINPVKKYHPDTCIVNADSAITDNYRETEISLFGLSSREQTQKMASYYLERLRLNKTVTLTVGSKALFLEPMDIVQISHNFTGWENKRFRVLSASVNPDSTVNLNLIEEHATFYDEQFNISQQHWHDTQLPDPSAPVPSVHNVAHKEIVYHYRGRSFSRWEIDFNPPSIDEYAWWDHAEIWMQIVEPEGTLGNNWRFITTSARGYQVDPVEEGKTYYCKIRSVSVHGSKENFATAYTISKNIQGITKLPLPPDLINMTAIANGDSVTIFADPLTHPDIEGYEVRLGDSWNGGIFISFNKNCSIRLTGVRPGTHTFWISPKDNSGRYSNKPAYATVTVFLPSGFSLDRQWIWNFVNGIHKNTKVDNSQLRCSHSKNNLTGTWTSPQYNLGGIKTVRIYGDFKTKFKSSKTTWQGVAPTGSQTISWIDLDIQRIWNEIFQPLQAGQLRAILRYKSTPDEIWNEVRYFEILCAEIQAKYIQMIIQITDPTPDAQMSIQPLNMKAYTWRQ